MIRVDFASLELSETPLSNCRNRKTSGYACGNGSRGGGGCGWGEATGSGWGDRKGSGEPTWLRPPNPLNTGFGGGDGVGAGYEIDGSGRGSP